MSTPRPARLLVRSGEKLGKQLGVYSWTIPALAARLPDGSTVSTCPAAGVCARVCYARFGSFVRFPSVVKRHVENLAYLVEDLPGWEAQLTREVAHPRHQGGFVRIHVAGDFFSDAYLTAWLDVARATPGVTFYSYTKEVERMKRLAEPDAPDNFLWVYSLGGREDHLIDRERDRICEVFPTAQALEESPFTSQEESDLYAVLGPRLVGIPANNIPAANRLIAGRTFGDWQRADDLRRAARRGPSTERQAADSGDS